MTGILQTNLRADASLEVLLSYDSPRRGQPGTWNFSDDWTAWGFPQNETVPSKNWDAYNLVACSTVITRFNLTHN